MDIIIVGGGEIGLNTANVLSAKEHDLVLIESDEARAKAIANEIDALVIHGDGTDMATLNDAGAPKADAIIAATNDDKTNLMICEIAKTMGVPKIIARVAKSEDEELFTKLGISGTISTVGIAVSRIKNLLMQRSSERIIYELGKGDVQVLAITLPKDSRLVGTAAVIKKAVIGTIYRNGDLILPVESTKFEEEDVLVLTAKTKDLPGIRKQIYGSAK